MELDQFFGFVFFIFMALCGFWGIKYLATFVIPFWLQGWFKMKTQERKNELEDVSRLPMSDQEGFEVIYQK